MINGFDITYNIKVGANAGMIGMTKEHLGIALSLGIPVLVVVTKIDRCPSNILQNTIKELGTILKSKSCRKIPLFVETDTDVVMTAVSDNKNQLFMKRKTEGKDNIVFNSSYIILIVDKKNYSKILLANVFVQFSK